MEKNFEKSKSLLIGTQICADIADIIKFFVKCDTVEELRDYLGEELGADFDYDNLLIAVEHIKKVYNDFRKDFYDDSAAYLTAQMLLICYSRATDDLRDKLIDFNAFFKLGISKNNVDEYAKFLNEQYYLY